MSNEATPDNLRCLILERAAGGGRTTAQAEAIYAAIVAREASQSIKLERMIPHPDALAALLDAEFSAVRDAHPELFRDVPSNEAVLQALTVQHEQAFGAPLAAQDKLAAHRRIQSMDDDEKLAAVGDYTPPAPEATPALPPRAPASQAVRSLKPVREIGMAEMNAVLREHYDGDVSSLTIMRRQALYEGLRQMQAKPDNTAATYNALAGIRGDKGLSPQERINAARAAGGIRR